ncbi:MGA_1079 family surface serine endopeptidase [Mycoplasma sp. CSL7503-lung]|uniref:MGA_1079 family surface serine endopeptidase n=1 Tax=Mycoplasma sp. CSL7503-lung TaxID=536372 RepID=UPI0021D03C4C|nr:hypothetical protein [Mycoplasma sp. CSL7503-lung]MCU4706295.1 hypothetical protein [Mycoplasma sp. CSL7503-lung]
MNNKKVLVFSALSSSALLSSTLAISCSVSTKNNNEVKNKYKNELKNYLEINLNHKNLNSTKNRILEQYPNLNTEKEYQNLNKNIGLILGNYYQISKTKPLEKNVLEINKDLENNINNGFDKLEILVNQDKINFNNFSNNLVLESNNIVKDLNLTKQNTFNFFKKDLEQKISSFSNEKISNFGKKISNLYPIENYSTEYIELNNKIIGFLTILNEFLKLNITKQLEGTKIEFKDEEQINELNNFIDNILNNKNLNFNLFTSTNQEKIIKLISLTKIKNILVQENNQKLESYINNLSLYNFQNQITKDIYLNKKSEAYNDFNFRNLLINNLNSLDLNISNIESIFEHYNFSKIKQDLRSEFNTLKEEFKSNNNFNLFSDFITKLKLVVSENNLVSDQTDIEDKKNILISKISNDNSIKTSDKELIKKLVNNSLTSIELENINKLLIKYNQNFILQKNELNQIINNALIDNSIKEDIVIITSQLNTFDEFISFRDKFNVFNEKINNLKTKIENFYNEISNRNVNGKKEYDFYIFLSKNRNIFNNNILLFDLSDMDNNIKLIEQLLIEFTNIQQEETNNNLSAIEILKTETENRFSLENYEGENKYNLDSIKNAASFNFENSKLFFDHFDTNLFNYTIKDIKLKGDKLNTLELTVEVKIKGINNISYTFTKTKEFLNGALDELNSLNFEYLDEIFDLNYDLLNSYNLIEFRTLPSFEKEEIFTKKYYGLGKYFKYSISDISINSNKINANLNILFNNQILKTIRLNSEKVFTERNISKEEYWDKVNKEKIMSIINSNDKTKFFLNVSLKNPKNRWNHSDFLASQAKEKMEQYYKMPKFGKYEIYIDEVANIDDFKHKADIKLWYKVDGIEAPKPKAILDNFFTIDDFMFLHYEDIKPKNEFFEESDFNDPKYDNNSIPENLKSQMNQLNESVFGWNLTLGSVKLKNGAGDKTNYRALNPVSFVEQKANNKLNYFISIKTGNDKAEKGDNFDENDFIGIQDKNKIYKKDITPFTENISKLLNDYFYYYYDIKLEGRRGISFKIGWINKANTNIRYTNNKTYNLVNLVNDFEQALYPEIMLNNIKLSDLVIDEANLKRHDIDYFIQHKEELNDYINLANKDENNYLTYRNFKLKANKFKINDIKKINNKDAYIKLEVEGFDPVQNKTKKFIGHSWYKITGFAKKELTENSQINLFDGFSKNKVNLISVFGSRKEITRKRLIEPYWKDVFWKYDEKEQNVFWYLDKKYLEKTLMRENTTKSQIDFVIYADLLLNDNDKSRRINRKNSEHTYSINFEQLLNEKAIIFNKHVEFGNNNKTENLDYKIIFKWDPLIGIKVIIDTDDLNNKIVINDPDVLTFKENQKFDPNKAIVVLPTASEITITYTNDKEKEEFEVDSNRFDYNDVIYTDNNQPILFSNDTKYLKDHSIYYPNQNVPYKFHEGYLMDADVLRWNKQEDWELARDTWMRTVQFAGPGYYGSTSIVGKVNDDINDHRYYLISNRHVVGEEIESFDKIEEKGKARYGLFLGTKHRNNIINKYWNFNQDNSEGKLIEKLSANTKVIWTGLNQISENNKENNGQIDLTLFEADLNDEYLYAKRNGKMNVVYKLDYINNYLDKVKFDVNYQESYIPVPSNRNVAIIGYPDFKMTGILSHRPLPSYTGNKDDRIGIQAQSNYAPVYLGGGGSGTSFYIDGNRYLATWREGFEGFDSFALRYWTKTYNFLGSNIEEQNPFDVNNTRSFASQIIRANLENPNSYSSPWFYKYDYNQEEDNE